jgi:predicted small secreted protein
MILIIKIMKVFKFLALGFAISALSALTSCQTVQGLGRDLEGAGNGLQKVGNR